MQSAHGALERRVYERTVELEEINAKLRQEIAGRQQTEAALRESEERFRQLVEHLNEIFWMSNADGSQVLYASPAYETVRGHSRQRLYANPADWIEAIHPEDRARLQDLHARIAAGIFNEEYGGNLWARANADRGATFQFTLPYELRKTPRRAGTD